MGGAFWGRESQRPPGSMATLGATLADLEAVAPDPRQWRRLGGKDLSEATSISELGLLPHAVLPLLCVLPALIAALRYLRRGRYGFALAAAAAVVPALPYHFCRLAGEGQLGLGAATLDCTAWRKLDVLALFFMLTFLAATAVGLADWRMVSVACLLYAKAVYMVLDAATRYHQLVVTLCWSLLIVVVNPLIARHSMPGGITDLNTALHPDLRGRAPVPRVLVPWLVAVICFALPCAGPNFVVSDPKLYWPSVWACHAAVGLSSCGILGAEVQSERDARAKARRRKAEAARPARKAPHRLAPAGKPKEQSGMARRRLSAELTRIATGLAEEHQHAAISATKVRVTGQAKVAGQPQQAGSRRKTMGQPVAKADLEWSPQYRLAVELDLGKRHGNYRLCLEAHRPEDDGRACVTGVSYADGSAPLRSLEGGGDASKRRRAQGHCKFELRDSTVATDADMECAPTCACLGRLAFGGRAGCLNGRRCFPGSRCGRRRRCRRRAATLSAWGRAMCRGTTARAWR